MCRSRFKHVGLIVACVVWLAVSSLRAAEPEVVVELGSPRIYEGESVQYNVLLNHFDNPKQPNLDTFVDFDVQYLGSSSQRYSINGRIVRDGQTFQYSLTPKKSGTLTIPAPVAEHNGKKLQGRTLTLEVVAPEEQDVAILKIEADREAVYPMQAFTVTLRIAIKGLPKPFEERNPVSVLRDLPALSIPWVDDESLPAGIAPDTAWQRWLGPYQNPRGVGFSVNNLSSGGISLFNTGPMAFMPEAKRTVRKDAGGNDADYWEFVFVRKFLPRELGDCTFGPVALKGTFVVNVDGRGQAETEDIYAIARPIRVTVKNAPEDGRPASFTGAIGEFKIASTLAPTNTKVGDPLTLTVTVTGQGTLANAAAPDLAGVAEITESFRVYDKPTEETLEDGRRFTFSLRPKTEGEITFPAIPLAYFDVEKEKYVTIHTEPIAVTVAKAQKLSGNEIAMASPAANGQQVQALVGGILANNTDRNSLRDQTVNAPAWFIVFGCMAGTFVVIVLVSDQVKQYFGNTQSIRRRAAPQRARQRLHEALAEVNKHKLREAADHLQAAFIGLIADVSGVDEAGLATGDVASRLIEMKIDDDLVRQTKSLLESCDGARYGASESLLMNLGEDARRLLDGLIKSLKKEKYLK